PPSASSRRRGARPTRRIRSRSMGPRRRRLRSRRLMPYRPRSHRSSLAAPRPRRVMARSTRERPWCGSTEGSQMFSRFCSLALAAALVGCAGPVPAGAPDASAPAHVYGAALPFAYPVVPPDGSVGDLCSVDGSTVPRVCSIQGVSVPPGGGGGAAYEAGTNTSQALVWSGSTYAPRQLTTDDLAPAFSIGLSAASGGGSPIQIGATWTPTFNVSYSPNGTGLTAATEADSLGNSLNVLGSSNPLASPATNYTQTSVNATVTVSVTATRSGVTKTSNGVGMQWEPFCWYGV